MAEESFLTKWERVIKATPLNGAAPSEVEVLQQNYIRELADAMWQLLDDMGKDGQTVCLYAKAQARVAFEPFRDADSPVDFPLADAEQIIRECR